jgi:hypothetical protein
VKRIVLGSVFTLAQLVLAGCGGEPEAGPAEEDGSAEALAALAASPCDVGSSFGIADSTVAQLLAGANRLDAEISDCQRLVLTTGPTGEFGPLVGLYPVDATLRLARTDFSSARAAAAIYSWGAAGGTYADAYPDFAPAPGVGCLWLRNADGTPAGWQAAIVAGAGCGTGAAAPAESEFTFPVFERAYRGVAPADYPPTARWQWDLDVGKHLIGLKCGDAWCEVAARGSGEPRAQALVGGNAVPREQVPGWSDAQHLAVYDSAAGRARPGPWASVVAYPGIAADAPPWAEGLLAGRITVYGDAGAFGERFYLEPERGSGYDDLILRFPGVQDEAWLQQGPMRRRQASRIQFRPTPDHAVNGAVRWRWQERGETIWIYCPSATCAVEP